MARTFEEYDREQTQKLMRRPKCKFCGEYIQDEKAFDVPIVGLTCKACVESWERWLDE